MTAMMASRTRKMARPDAMDTCIILENTAGKYWCAAMKKSRRAF
jgi:hypothetical protein